MNTIHALQRQLDQVSPEDIFVYICFTAKHPKRIPQTSISGSTGKVQNDKNRATIVDMGGSYYLDIVHHVDANGDGFVDSIQLPNFQSLENLVEVLTDIDMNGIPQNG